MFKVKLEDIGMKAASEENTQERLEYKGSEMGWQLEKEMELRFLKIE